MKTIGVFLKEARQAKKYSLGKLAQATKIKTDFIEAIESENWKVLPEYPVTLGFVKSLAVNLGIEEGTAAAFFRRDYPPQKVNPNPKPDVGGKFVWSPRLTFAVGIGLFLLLVFGYLFIQYRKFSSSPRLSISEPVEGRVVRTRQVEVVGVTDSDVILKINNQPVLVGDNGKFDSKIDIYEGTNEVVVKVISRSGKETVKRVGIKPELGR